MKDPTKDIHEKINGYCFLGNIFSTVTSLFNITCLPAKAVCIFATVCRFFPPSFAIQPFHPKKSPPVNLIWGKTKSFVLLVY